MALINLNELEKQIRISMENALKALQVAQIEMNKSWRAIDYIRTEKLYKNVVELEKYRHERQAGKKTP